MEFDIAKACEYLTKSHREDAPEWATVEALRSIASAQIAQAMEQRTTNELLALALQTAVSISRYGDTSDVESVLDDFTRHARPDWPGHCGMEVPEVG